MLFRTALITSLFFLASCDSSSPTPAANVSSEPSAASPTEQSQALLDNLEEPAGEIETVSGLKYEALIPADGEKPTAGSIVTLHYVGSLTDGTVFDSSFARGAPATFELSKVIEGFSEGVQLMNVGSRYRLIIPGHLAYGDVGNGELIGPDETLIFEVHLLEINS